LRTRQYKYIVYSEGTLREQLFDLSTDPGETNNMAVDSSKKTLLDDFRTRLQQWCRETGDLFEIPSK
jgi:hypothetical protein